MVIESLGAQSAAFIAASLIAKSDKIQTTRFALDLWEELQNHIKIDSRLEFLVVILSQGRLMDLKIEEGKYLKVVQESLENIRRELIIKLTYPILGEKNGTEILAESYIVRLNDIASAMVTSSIVDLSEKVESAKEILDMWDKLRKENIVDSNNDYITALLVTSRINDLKKEIKHSGELSIVIENFENLLLNLEPDLKVTKIDLAAAYLTIAVVTQTPEVESHGQIISIWKRFKKELNMNDSEADVVSSILTGGLIRNMKIKMDFSSIKDIFSRIRNKVQDRI